MPASCLTFAASIAAASALLAPLLELRRVVDDLGGHLVMIGGEIERVRIRLELRHAARLRTSSQVARVGVQVQLVVHDDAEQALVDEDADAAENRLDRDAPEKRELLLDVTGEAPT